jgi:ubiquitin carboxyl-terminal hydrolase 10
MAAAGARGAVAAPTPAVPTAVAAAEPTEIAPAAPPTKSVGGGSWAARARASVGKSQEEQTAAAAAAAAVATTAPPAAAAAEAQPNASAATADRGREHAMEKQLAARTAFVNRCVRSVRSDRSRRFLKPRGLINNGNTCFMNVILQCLMACPQFFRFIMELGEPPVSQ